ncbi:hypothetical protein BV898_10811 [Hypsibius exemplaris]|uniref:ISXO2-like transposase domain-containing protein n=1 Tax=Hypsibius exemplaris TaxID=2072580 RepID=A0A1W0WIR9_HYPEX|nr:hypothetical protein BV898_10811 [Hypsibius exemplaris]
MNFLLLSLIVGFAVVMLSNAQIPGQEKCPTCDACPTVGAQPDAAVIRRQVAVNAARARTNVQVKAINGRRSARKQAISGGGLGPETTPCVPCTPCGDSGSDLRSQVWRIINRNLAAKKRLKRKTHLLSDKQVAQRVLKVPWLLEHFKEGKWRYIVSIDETWRYMSHVNGRQRIYYNFREQESSQSWLKHCRLRSSQQKSQFFLLYEACPEAAVQKDIPKLYGTDAKHVALHHDSAAAHTALDTFRSLQYKM